MKHSFTKSCVATQHIAGIPVEISKQLGLCHIEGGKKSKNLNEELHFEMRRLLFEKRVMFF